MNADGIVDLAGIATRHDDGNRCVADAAESKYAPIALGKTVETQGQSPQAVIAIGVGAGQVDHQIGPSKIEGDIQAMVQMQQVGFVSAAVRQFNIKVARFLVERVIAGAMDGEGKDAVVATQDAGGTVALMNVAVDDEDAFGPAFGLHGAGGDGGVVKTFTWSMSEKSGLRAMLESWRGKAFQDSDFEQVGGFQIQSILGKPCFINIKHETAQDDSGKVYANIDSITRLPKGMTVGGPTNPMAFVWLSHDEFDPRAFEGLSDRLKETIMKAPEYRQAVTGEMPGETPPADQPGHDDPNDEIPF